MKKLFNGLMAAAIVISPMAKAELKPAGTVLASYCGDNVASVDEFNHAITQVCLGAVEGTDLEVVMIHAQDGSGRDLPVQILPVVSKKKLSNPIRRHFQTQLIAASGEVSTSRRYDMLKMAKITVLSKIEQAGGMHVYTMPVSLTGTDLDGNAFKVDSLQPIMHTQSL